MKLSDVMGAANLAIYAEVGLLLFLLAFIGVAFRLFVGPGDEFEALGQLPLDEEKNSVAREDGRS